MTQTVNTPAPSGEGTGIQIVSSPTYPSAGGTFAYNVVGAGSTVSYCFRSVQARPAGISQQEKSAVLALRDDITGYLAEVARITGANPRVYLEDNQPGTFDYTGTYEVTDYASHAEGQCRMLLKAPGNESPTFYGTKEFPEGGTSQLVYRYRPRMTYQVYDVSTMNGVSRNMLLATRRQQLSVTGYNWFNVSELAKGYLSQTGSLTLRVKAACTDHFGPAGEVETDPCVLVQSRVPEVNYGAWTLFNPDNAGSPLPATGYELLYDDATVYPFYVNFVTNTLAGEQGIILKLEAQLYNGDVLLASELEVIPTVVGLGTVDVAACGEIRKKILETKPTGMRFLIHYYTEIGGEFVEEQFDRNEFYIGASGAFGKSKYLAVPCRRYTLDNRRDFYFSYQNGIGGISTYLCTQYRRIAEPEIVALRNASTISNSVARETESVELTFKYADLRGLDFLTGYRMDGMLKYDGIFESRNVERIGADGSRMLWIVRPGSYDFANSTLYKDLTVTIYRPVGLTAGDEKHR